MDFQEFVEMMIKVCMDDSYHNYQYDHGHSVPISGEEQLRFHDMYFCRENQRRKPFKN